MALLAVVPPLSGCESLIDAHLHTQSSAPPAKVASADPQALTLVSDGRRLAARLVPASVPDGPLILILHGDGETVADWRAAQAFLASQGFDSLSFDYSGFGSSEGHPTVDGLRRDAIAAFAEAQRFAARRRERVYVVAHSLGCDVIIDAAAHLPSQPAGYALWGAAASVRTYAVRSGALPGFLAFIIPDRWNNVRDAPDLRAPTLVLHGEADRNAPASGEHAIADRAGAVYVEVPNADHNALHSNPTGGAWTAILAAARTTAASQAPP